MDWTVIFRLVGPQTTALMSESRSRREIRQENYGQEYLRQANSLTSNSLASTLRISWILAGTFRAAGEMGPRMQEPPVLPNHPLHCF